MKLFISLLLSFLLATLGYVKKALTPPALILAFIFACIITYFGGVSSFLMLATVFLLTIIAGKIKKEERKNKIKDLHQKGHQKDVPSIIANVAPGTLCLILYGLTNNAYLLVVYATLMAEAISDSLASDIGILSSKPPINILTLKRSTPGLSGNISLLGIFASFIGSLIIALIYLIFNHNIFNFLIITICGTLGNLIDSFLGALVQAKYECPTCHIITEKTEHCATKTKKIAGIDFLNNDIVNITSNIISGLLCYLILIAYFSK